MFTWGKLRPLIRLITSAVELTLHHYWKTSKVDSSSRATKLKKIISCKRSFTELTNKMQSAFKSSQFIITVSMNTAILVIEELEAAEGLGSMVNWTSSFLPWQSSKGFRKWLEMLCVKFRELFENKRASFGSSTERCKRRSKSLDLREVFRKLSKLFYLRYFLLRQVLNNRNEYTRWYIFLCVHAPPKSQVEVSLSTDLQSKERYIKSNGYNLICGKLSFGTWIAEFMIGLSHFKPLKVNYGKNTWLPIW